MRTLLFLLGWMITKTVLATDPYPRNEAIDVRHYLFRLELNDSTDRIAGEATITIRFKKPIQSFELDLTGTNNRGNGMKVEAVASGDRALTFQHQGNRLRIDLPFSVAAGEDRNFTVWYSGIPEDGLIISRNKFGDRTFFGDNWPDRARHWLPCIDHPYDKATLEFAIVAPAHYDVVATGKRAEESYIGKNQKLTRWKTSVILPTKVITIGVAHFAVSYEGLVSNVPLESWVYPQNRAEGFKDYGMAAGPLNFFINRIAPYPYEKLANVQSKTRWGGLENAGNIFYTENSVTGRGTIEGLLAHEIAHQWFGDSASEADWFHVWLSEGFATYFTHLYFEATYGRLRLMDELRTDRTQVIEYFPKNPTPIVNEKITDMNKVLSTNTYQKAGWVLHMLRRQVGDQKFWEGIRAYYQKYQLGNALTEDFRAVMEEVSGKDLKSFFQQWIYQPGHPQLEVTWRYESALKQVVVTVLQKQAGTFEFPLDLMIRTGSDRTEKLNVTAKKQEFRVSCEKKPVGIELDPEVWLLFEGTSRELK